MAIRTIDRFNPRPAGGRWRKAVVAVVAALLLVIPGTALAQEDDDDGMSEADRETMAMDSTATQWSFQFAYQMMPDYYDDTLDNGQVRGAGLDDYLQVRIVAPIPLEKMTILPRITLRHYQAPNGESGLGNTEIFALIMPKPWDWGSGRFGIGPLVTLPGSTKVSKDEFGYGLAMAAVNSAGKWYYGILLTQSWQSVDPATLPAGKTDTNALGIAPFLNYRIANGWYVGNGDMVAKYDWDKSEFFMPLGVRIGKVIVKPNDSWNLYFEYQTSVIYDGWSGSAVKNSYRFNVSYTIPVG